MHEKHDRLLRYEGHKVPKKGLLAIYIYGSINWVDNPF